MADESDLVSFIRCHFPNVWSLEILLLLRRAEAQSWAVDEIVRELRASRGLVASTLAELERSGLLVRRAAGHQFAPPAATLTEICERLDALYRERPVAVISLISAPEDRLQELADAFRIKDRRK